MIFLNNIANFIEQIDQKKFLYYVAAASAILAFLLGIILYRYYAVTGSLLDRTKKVNMQRKVVKELLERYEIVKKQQMEVNALLEKDKNFKIGGYFEDIVARLNLSQFKTREPETSSQELDNGYTEIKLYASFANINMQKIVELLDTLEQNERIYTKEIEIYKPNQDRAVNLNLLIATLTPIAEAEQTQ